MRHLQYTRECPSLMSANMLYTDLSAYYDLMCADIDYFSQSQAVRRLHQIFGNGCHAHLDLACGTGPHVRNFIDAGYQSQGLDINQPMLDIAKVRCPEAEFSLQNMCDFSVTQPVDLISCFLYSLHYNPDIKALKNCFASVHQALNTGGVFCFNSVDKNSIDNSLMVKHSVKQQDETFSFSSGWHYSGQGATQTLKLSIEKTNAQGNQVWIDEHPMVAVSFNELIELLKPNFDVHVFEHDYQKIIPWGQAAGNAIFVCVKN